MFSNRAGRLQRNRKGNEAGNDLPRGVNMADQLLPSFAWFNPTRVVFGVGKLDMLPTLIDEVAGRSSRVFLVTGRRSLRARGILQKVEGAIGEHRITLFDQVTPFPSPDLVDEAAQICRQASADIVAAIGGGSVMDLAKKVIWLINYYLLLHGSIRRGWSLESANSICFRP